MKTSSVVVLCPHCRIYFGADHSLRYYMAPWNRWAVCPCSYPALWKIIYTNRISNKEE